MWIFFCILFYCFFSRLVIMYKFFSNIFDLVLFGYLKGEYYGNNLEMFKLFYKVVCEKSEIVYVVYQQYLVNCFIMVSVIFIFLCDDVLWNK